MRKFLFYTVPLILCFLLFWGLSKHPTDKGLVELVEARRGAYIAGSVVAVGGAPSCTWGSGDSDIYTDSYGNSDEGEIANIDDATWYAQELILTATTDITGYIARIRDFSGFGNLIFALYPNTTCNGDDCPDSAAAAITNSTSTVSHTEVGSTATDFELPLDSGIVDNLATGTYWLLVKGDENIPRFAWKWDNENGPPGCSDNVDQGGWVYFANCQYRSKIRGCQ